MAVSTLFATTASTEPLNKFGYCNLLLCPSLSQKLHPQVPFSNNNNLTMEFHYMIKVEPPHICICIYYLQSLSLSIYLYLYPYLYLYTHICIYIHTHGIVPGRSWNATLRMPHFLNRCCVLIIDIFE